MPAQWLSDLAVQLLHGAISVEQFVSQIERTSVADLGEVQLDLDRQRRCGFPEVIYGQGKPIPVLIRAVEALHQGGSDVLATRISQEQADVLLREFPGSRYNAVGRIFRWPHEAHPVEPHGGHVVVVTAGTTDLPVAEEARETALWTGAKVVLVQDVGVAGPQRLRAQLELLRTADVIVVVAGMEGALPSVVGGYVSCPVIGVPTSVGYGANLQGFAALLSMLNSCASNVTVVNIDAGFKGGYVAGLIARSVVQGRPRG